MKTITLPRTIANQILTQAQQQPEAEACGLVSARDGIPCHIYPITNIAEDKQRQFELDPAQQIKAMKTMRETGEELFAIYHSHPHAPAEPSATDIQQSSYPDALYLIISLDTKGVLDMRGFYVRNDAVEGVELVI